MMTNPPCPTCATPIREHPATRCLDAWLARDLVGWKPHPFSNFPTQMLPPDGPVSDSGIPQVCSVPHYSTNIAAAWTIVELFDARSYKVNVHNRIGKWACSIITNVGDKEQEAQFFEYGDNAPMAICLAAIIAVVGGTTNGNV